MRELVRKHLFESDSVSSVNAKSLVQKHRQELLDRLLNSLAEKLAPFEL